MLIIEGPIFEKVFSFAASPSIEKLSIPHEHWSLEKIKRQLPVYDLRQYGPPKRMEDENFGEPTGKQINGAVFFPMAGYINDPKLATQNIQEAAESFGASFLFNQTVVDIPVYKSRVEGVVLADGVIFYLRPKAEMKQTIEKMQVQRKIKGW